MHFVIIYHRSSPNSCTFSTEFPEYQENALFLAKESVSFWNRKISLSIRFTPRVTYICLLSMKSYLLVARTRKALLTKSEQAVFVSFPILSMKNTTGLFHFPFGNSRATSRAECYLFIMLSSNNVI